MLVDLTGRSMGRWLVIERAPNHGNQTYWRCVCACGTERDVQARGLKEGSSTSCGCYRRENPNNRTHGKTKTQEFRIWAGIKGRCFNKNVPNYVDYGGRGIGMAPQWRDSFERFLADMGPRPSPKHSVDRIDNDRDYEPGNCRWATQKVQSNNSRHNRLVQVFGETLTLAQCEAKFGIRQQVIGARLRLGWPPDSAVSEPVRRGNRLRNVKSDCEDANELEQMNG